MIEWFAPEAKRASRMRIAFVDRDGVINEHILNGYVLEKKQFRLLPGVVENLRRLRAGGWEIIVVTNQSCINRGLVAAETVRSIMDGMIATLNAADVPLLGWICCPHRPDEFCKCRKPGTAMLERAAIVTGSNLSKSILIGDSPSDIAASFAAGVNGVLISGNSQASFTQAIESIGQVYG